MLELRPSCENCDASLLPNSLEAMICSFECTFCRSCAEEVLGNVCPNCGGGFSKRPHRPSTNWNGENYLGKYPASLMKKHQPIDIERHRTFAASLKNIAPENR